MSGGARFARCFVRFVFNLGGVAAILALTATTFDATEFAAIVFMALWFGVVEAAAAFGKVEPRQDGRAHWALCPLFVLAALPAITVTRAPEPKGEVVVAANCRAEYPRACAAIQRLRDRGI